MAALSKGGRLGRGLDALFADGETSRENMPPRQLPITQLEPGKFQPRRYFDDDALATLAASIKTHGILQPILVREKPRHKDQYEIIAGERRWRAAQMAGLTQVPVVLRDLQDRDAFAVALIENLQREDLNPIEEARAYKKLIAEFGHTQQKLAEILGKSRSHLANMMRLLVLPESVQDLVIAGKLSAGHARALVSAENPEDLAQKILAGDLTVRAVERIIAEEKGRLSPSMRRSASQSVSRETSVPLDPEILALQQELTSLLGLPTTIRLKGSGGQLIVSYQTLEQLDDILQKLSR